MTKLTLQDSTLYDNEPKETSKASKEMNAVDALRCQYENGFVNCLHLTDEENAREVKDCPVWYEIKGGKHISILPTMLVAGKLIMYLSTLSLALA